MNNSKKCFKCDIEKQLSDFYQHKGMADGHLNKCKECTKKDTKNNVARNYDYYREYEFIRANNPNRVEARKRYSKTDEGIKAARRAKKKWGEHNIIKRSASILVRKAIREGKLIRPNVCSACKNKSSVIHGHHDNYNYPMVVRWLCPKCHKEWHKLNGSGLNG